MKKYILHVVCAVGMWLGTSSCTDYLDKEPGTDVDMETAYKNFTNFQGFIEQIYNCIPNKESNYWCTNFNWGEDEVMNAGGGDSHFTAHVDLGDYRYWYSDSQNFLHASTLNPNAYPDSDSYAKFYHSIEHAWYCIRKCNLGLENIDLMVDATGEERNFVKGQLLFFRAWWHHQLIEFYGGMPYIDRVLPAGEQLTEERLTFQEAPSAVPRTMQPLPNCCPTTGTSRR